MELNKYNKPSPIPLAKDLMALSLLLNEKANAIMESGRAEITPSEYRELSEITLAQLVLFNKRRAGEAERLEVKQFIEGVEHGKTVHEEVLESLSPLERKLVDVIDRVEIRWKRGRRVAILLPQILKKQVDVLFKCRSSAYIDESNKYVFARPGKTPFRSTDALRKYAALCGAKQPHTLTSTGFRKHVATMSQMLNLKDNELNVLATFLGHDIRVHREYYRLPENTIQVNKLSFMIVRLV
ncbi:hypothetical protein DPMN_158153 [Dreissena polymorpha]|uniref:Uncharacterized protein n=1 Tax=Dreissena polymorpha TaxID=45954 RepID=A0A9D4EIK6_DREPO|nr:hypothetical protein DPMN_158153 [Dreissena polymorpha]